MQATGTVEFVNVGRAQPLQVSGRTVLSGFRKQPVDGEVQVGPTGLIGDEQADLTVHGGVAKAVYAYPAEHYAFWQTVRAQARVALWDEVPPAALLGENLTLRGLLEQQVWIGDLLRLPGCTLAVSEPRFPCGKLNAAMGFPQAGKMMWQSGYCGFYLAVREPGSLRAGDRFEVVPGPREVSIPELFRARRAARA
ncbi:MOSC domain-containing protein [Aquincola tertiaricarbonis]|uniref:MOSC domain-containing protein n=1 Tax=Aquincola tertiaricarbonis TaxID=391953 RepID=UPI000614D17A|nr:MOSC domain-containing protein [Aquincola tertiaricarbonis]